MAIDPRLKDVQDMRAVQKGGWFLLEDLSEVKAGTAAIPVISVETNHTLNSSFNRFLGAGQHYANDIYTELGSPTGPTAFTTSIYVAGLRVRAELQGTFTTGGGLNGLEAEAILGALGEHNGSMFAGQFYLRMDARVAPYTYIRNAACIALKSNIGTNVAIGGGINTMSFIRLSDAAATHIPFFLHLAQAAGAPGTQDAVIADTAGGNGDMSLRVSINGAVWYIPMSASVV